jgi:hypothetical protein
MSDTANKQLSDALSFRENDIQFYGGIQIEARDLSGVLSTKCKVCSISKPSGGSTHLSVTNGTCVIGPSDEYLVKDVTFGLPGQIKSVVVSDQVFRVTYSRMHDPLERFSITSEIQ